MKKAAMYNFHLPLPEGMYQDLRAEAERSAQPATTLARKAIGFWLKQRVRQKRHQEIAAYVNEMVGTGADLDPAFESAAVEHWLAEEAQESK